MCERGAPFSSPALRTAINSQLPRKERTRQWRTVPAHAPSGILHHLQRSMGRRKGIVEELALARQHLGSSVEERARHDDNPRPRTRCARDAHGRGKVAFSVDRCSPGRALGRALTYILIGSALRGRLLARVTLVERCVRFAGIL